MESRRLGRRGPRVSRLVFGTLAMGRAQAGLSPEAGGELLAFARSLGIDCLDTADAYDTYPHVREGLRRAAAPLAIVSKTYAWDRAGALAAVERARRETGADRIDAFLLHEQESFRTLLGHRDAFEALLDLRERGVLGAVGFSTHAVGPVSCAAAALGVLPEDGSDPWEGEDPGPYREIDLVHPLLNVAGVGLLDGGPGDMARAVTRAHEAGVGVLGMKMLGGGTLLPRFDEAAAFALGFPAADAWAVGMQDEDEVRANVALFEGRAVPDPVRERLGRRRRRLLVESWCSGCGACVARCGQGALRLEEGRAVVDPARCVLCGYCAAVCRDFCIKVV